MTTRATRGRSLLHSSAASLIDAGHLAIAAIRHGAILAASPGFVAMFGERRRLEEALCEAGDRERLEAALASDGAVVTVVVRRPDGPFDVELLVAPGPEPADVVVVATNVTERRRAERLLSSLAFRDPLTQLANRALLADRLRDVVVARRADGRAFGVIACDLDGFKSVNDTLGHDAGDEVLRATARRLEQCVRDSDLVARLGGDEFALLLAHLARPEDAAIVATRVVRAFDAPIPVAGMLFKVGVSVGVATAPPIPVDGATLRMQADIAMYASKRAGKNQFSVAPAVERAVAVPFLPWTKTHAVGLAVIDRQHEALFDRVNAVGAVLAGGGNEARPFKALLTFARKHFAAEERLMAAAPGWPREEEHRREHARLLDELGALATAQDARSVSVTTAFLREWLVRHMDGLDRPLAEHLRASAPSGAGRRR